MKFMTSPSFSDLPLKNVQTYTEDEINELFDLSEEEAVELTKVISNQVAINKVYSSQKTEERLAEILTEANEFAIEQLGKSNFLSIALATSVDEVVDEHILYLVDDGTSTNTYNQYVLINGVATLLGSTQCDLSDYVTNEQLDTKLEDYTKKNEVLSASDIVTTIDDTVTGNQIPSALAVYEKIQALKIYDNTKTLKECLDVILTDSNFEELIARDIHVYCLDGTYYCRAMRINDYSIMGCAYADSNNTDTKSYSFDRRYYNSSETILIALN